MRAFETLTPSQLYRKWEGQQWKAAAIDLSKDRDDWLGMTDQERWQWYWLACFSHFHQSETDAVVWLSTVLPCLVRPDQQHFLSTQIADEARHAYFFERFYREVVLKALPDGEVTISPTYQRLFIEMPAIVAQNLVRNRSHDHLGVAAFHVFILLEGSIALASFSLLRRLLMKTRRFPGLLRALTFAQRDEVRHAQFGLSVLRDLFAEQPSSRNAVRLHMREQLPVFSAVLEPRPSRKETLEALGLDPFERRRKAFMLLQRNLRDLGLDDMESVELSTAGACL
jgi:ribonucleoside-diphosphate reductase beta chain